MACKAGAVEGSRTSVSGTFFDKIDRFVKRYSGFVPFTRLNTVASSLDKRSRTALDLGCAQGWPMLFINRKHRLEVTSADIYRPYLDEARSRGGCAGYVQCDAKKLPFRSKSFDTVFCMEMIEHLEKLDGFAVISDLERTARRQVVLTTPMGAHRQDVTDQPGEGHRSAWSPAELRAMGYKVRGTGAPTRLYEKNGLLNRGAASRLLGFVVMAIPGPFVYFFPRLGGNLVASKDVSR